MNTSSSQAGGARPAPGEQSPAGDDHTVPFQVDGLDVRGRGVQLGAMLTSILERHNYPDSVSRLVAEAITLTALLGTSLKFDGRLIFQTQSDGPVSLLVVDFATPADMRAYARFDHDKVAALEQAGSANVPELLGQGAASFTIDQGPHMQTYQGLVALNGVTFEQVAQSYFQQSEQIPTRIRLAAAELFVPNQTGGTTRQWRAGGVLAQYLPDSGLPAPTRDWPDGREPDQSPTDGIEAPSWDEASILMGTIDDSELTDPNVGSERLLYRLFHEHGVRVYAAAMVNDNCSCTRERIKAMLAGFSPEDIAHSTVDNMIEVKCEFCGQSYSFQASDFIKV